MCGHFCKKNRASLQKHSQLICLFFFSLFYIYSVISASVVNIAPFIEAVDEFRNVCLVDYLITVFLWAVCRKLSITSKLRTVLTLLLLTMAFMESVFIADK